MIRKFSNVIYVLDKINFIVNGYIKFLNLVFKRDNTTITFTIGKEDCARDILINSILDGYKSRELFNNHKS